MKSEVHEAEQAPPGERDDFAWKGLTGPLTSPETIPSLLRTVGHQLSQPLTACRGTLDLVLYKGRSISDYRAACDRALAAVERMVAIVRMLQDLADVSGPPGKRVSLELTSLARRAVEEIASLARTREVNLSLERSPKVVARGDRSKCYQAVLKLLRLAVVSCSEGGRVVISAGSYPKRASVLIEVEERYSRESDPPDPREPAMTLPRHRTGAPPSQWALAAPRLALEASGGSVAAEVTGPRGLRFRINLPMGGGEKK